jgi:hypothetical protein
MNNNQHRLLIVALVAGWCAVTPQSVSGQALPVPPGFDFPAARADLEKMRDDGNVAGMRKHAWMVFAGLTQPTPGGEPIWETWYSSLDVMSGAAGGAQPQGLGPKRRTLRQPRQIRGENGLAVAQAPGASLAELVLFNEVSRKEIQDNKYNKAATLNAINDGWPAGTTPENRKIKDFPEAAMSIKTAWYLVKKTGMTSMPIWDDQAREATYPSLPPETWPDRMKRVLAVDPVRTTIPAGETATVNFGGKAYPQSKVVPLSAFYSFKLTQEMVDSLRQTAIFGDAPEAGDYLALVNLHYTTKEIPDWVWATFWWHDQPDQQPYGSDRPAEVKGLWRNYKMDVAFSMDTPKESDNTANAVFNPWLEGRFANGANSNCMTCHQRAVWPGVSFLPVTRGALPPSTPLFKNRTKVDFLWSVVLESN